MKERSTTSRRGRRSKRLPTHRRFRPWLEVLEDRRVLSTDYWVNPKGGDWDTAANWSTGLVPGAADDVKIAVTPTAPITHSQATADSVNSITDALTTTRINPFDLVISGGSLSIGSTSILFSPKSQVEIDSGGTLTGAGLLQLDNLLWDGGTMSGSGTTTVESILTITGSAVKTLSGRTLNNFGQATWSGTGNWNAGNGATIVNELGATFSVTATATLVNNGGTTPSFTNDSTVQETAGTGSTIGIPFTDNDQVLVESGTLVLGGGGSKAASTTDTVSAGAVLQFGNPTLSIGPTYTLDNGVRLVGGGTYNVSGGTLQIGQSAFDIVTVQNLEVDTGGTVAAPVGTASATILSVNGNFLWTGGTLSGLLDVEVTVPASATINSLGTLTLDGATLFNEGAMTWDNGRIEELNNGEIENAGGTFSDQSDSSFINGDGSTAGGFLNFAQFQELAGSSTDIDVLFTNRGAVDVSQDSTLNLNGGGDNGVGASFAGAFSVDAGSKLNFGGGTYTLVGGTSLSGGGTYDVTGGTLQIGQSAFDIVTVQNLEVDTGGTVAAPVGTASATILSVNGNFLCTGGTLSGLLDVEITAPASATINSLGTLTLDGATLFNKGAVTWDNGRIEELNNGEIENAGGTFSDQSDSSFINGDGSTAGGFLNFAQFQEFAGSSTDIDVLFTNRGAVDVSQDSTLNLNGGGDNGVGASFAGAFSVDAGSKLNFGGGTYTLINNTNLTGNGLYDVSGGTLQIGQVSTDTVTVQNFEVDTGGTAGDPGTLQVNGHFNWAGGTLGQTFLLGEVEIVSGAGMVIDPSASVTLNSITLQIDSGGSADWDSGQIQAENDSTLKNYGTFTDVSNGSTLVSGGVDNLFDNYGLFQEFSGTGTTIGGVQFINEAGGTLDVVTGAKLSVTSPFFRNRFGASVTIGAKNAFGPGGILNINGGGDDGIGDSGPGSFFVDAGGTLNFGGGTYTLVGGTDLSGGGTYDVTGGTLQIGQSAFDIVTVRNLEVDTGGTVAGPVGTASATILSVNGNFLWTGGALSGLLDVEVTVAASATINSLGTLILDGATLFNEGAMTWDNGRIEELNNGEIENAAGTFSDQSDSSFINGDGSTAGGFLNFAQFQEFAGSSTDIDVLFTNRGAVDVSQDSTLNLNGGGDNGAGTSFVGSFSVDAGSTLNFGGGTYTLLDGSSLTGGGTYDVTGGRLQLGLQGGDTVTVQNFEVDPGGIVSGPDNLNVDGNFLWTGGVLGDLLGSFPNLPLIQIVAGAGLVINTPLGGCVTLDSGELSIDSGATALWVDGDINAVEDAVVVNNGAFTDLSDNSFSSQVFIGNEPFYQFENYGIFQKSSPGTSSVDVDFFNEAGASLAVLAGTLNLNGSDPNSNGSFENQGAVNVGLASEGLHGTLNVNGGGDNSSAGAPGTFLVDAGSTLNFGGNMYTLVNGTQLTGTGTYDVVDGGALQIGFGPGDTVTARNFEEDPGATVDGSGLLNIDGNFLWTGGNLEGEGFVLEIHGPPPHPPQAPPQPGGSLTINAPGGVTLEGTELQIDSGATANWRAGSFFLTAAGGIDNHGNFVDESGDGITTNGIGIPGGEFDNFGDFAEGVPGGPANWVVLGITRPARLERSLR